jgi:hypothetical protein
MGDEGRSLSVSYFNGSGGDDGDGVANVGPIRERWDTLGDSEYSGKNSHQIIICSESSLE